jgi:hypothetical protein
MNNKILTPFGIDFDSYILQGEPEKKDNGSSDKRA